MTVLHNGFFFGTLYLVAGVLLLTYLDKIVEFDENSGIKLKAFFRRKLGDSSSNRELWSAGTPSGYGASRVAFRLVGVVFVLVGIAKLLLTFRGYLH
jgi:hypothetical protein